MPTKRAGKDDEADNPTALSNMVWLRDQQDPPPNSKTSLPDRAPRRCPKRRWMEHRLPLHLIAKVCDTSITYMDPIPDEQDIFAVTRSKSLIRL